MTIYFQKGYAHSKLEVIEEDLLSWLKSYTAPEFNLLDRKTSTQKEDIKRAGVGYIISGEMSEPIRSNENLLTRNAVMLDYDFKAKDNNEYTISPEGFVTTVKRALSGYNYAVYPSFSANPEEACYHVIIPVDRPLKQKEYTGMFIKLAKRIGIPVDDKMLNWSQLIGLPVKTKQNQSLEKIMVTERANFPTEEKDQLERMAEGVEEFKKAQKEALNPSQFSFSKIKVSSTSPEATGSSISDSSKLSDEIALEMFKSYTEADRANLKDYNNAIPVIEVLAKSVQDGIITEGVAYECCEIMALGNEEWHRDNIYKLKHALRNTVRTEYSFLDKFVIAVGNAKQYASYLPVPDDVKEALLSIDFSKDTLDTVDEKVKKHLSKEQIKQLYANNNVYNSFSSFLDYFHNPELTTPIPTGFKKLDELLNGGLSAGLYGLGAISSLGKTTLLHQIADNISASGKDVLFFSLEMARHELIGKSLSRLTCLISQEEFKGVEPLSYNDVMQFEKREKLTNKQRELLETALEVYPTNYAKHITIRDNHKRRQTVGDIERAVKQHVEITGNSPVVFVDYLQLLAPENARQDIRATTDDAVTRLKMLSAEYNIPVVVISSFNRDAYTNAVSMSSFKESGGIEYSCDVLIGLQLNLPDRNPEKIDKEKAKVPRKIELKLLKQRNGIATGKLDYNYDPRYNYFEEVVSKKKFH